MHLPKRSLILSPYQDRKTKHDGKVESNKRGPSFRLVKIIARRTTKLFGASGYCPILFNDRKFAFSAFSAFSTFSAFSAFSAGIAIHLRSENNHVCVTGKIFKARFHYQSGIKYSLFL